MLTIGKDQLARFREPPRRAFEAEMVEHLAAFSPPLFKTLGEDQMLVVVRTGMAAAERHGFDLRGPVRMYLELMLLFGSRFDTDPQYPWFHELLTAEPDAPQMQRAGRIHARVTEYRRQVAGPDDDYTFAALRRILQFAEQPLDYPPAQIVGEMARQFAAVYPEKVAWLGEPALTNLIEEGVETARRLKSPSARGEALMSVLMFAFGHGCADDPLYPWIANTIRDGMVPEPARWPVRLEKKAITWLRHVLGDLPRRG